MEIKSTRPVACAEAKEILIERKEGTELGYEQSQALENLERFAPMKSEQSKALIDKLKKGGKISEEMAAKIVDISPHNPATLKAVLSKGKVELSEEELTAIVKEFA